MPFEVLREGPYRASQEGSQATPSSSALFVYSDANSEVRVWDVLPMTLSVSDPLTHNPTHNRKLLDGDNGAARKQMLLILEYKPSNGAENGR